MTKLVSITQDEFNPAGIRYRVNLDILKEKTQPKIKEDNVMFIYSIIEKTISMYKLKPITQETLYTLERDCEINIYKYLERANYNIIY